MPMSIYHTHQSGYTGMASVMSYLVIPMVCEVMLFVHHHGMTTGKRFHHLPVMP